ncbi:MAG: alpha/beta hydrolase [Ruminococcus sp.]|uniref:Alpha/beta hydrolase n=1 Tax=Schaedlerella arabinosiphila TaxID=2044587 RepID=A0A3R8JL29_9FIRM|nr:alpha/beta hydrolase [Schaedlerella arabinosiphila]MCI8722950.1 alpha/beta hydrolase [Ruminococcus sp.]RRK30743.1 alpha/beta hydrolase [Schaedlerella arabinosiphila]
MISRQAQELMNMLREGKEASKGQSLSPEETVKLREKLNTQMNNTPLPEGIQIKDIHEGGVMGEFHHNLTPGKSGDKIVLFIFGGGFETGSVISRRNCCSQVALAAGMDAFAVSYRQWPEAMYPAALEDCTAAFHWLEKKGYRPENIRIFGESAGANLTIATTMYLNDHGQALPGRICPFSPVIDVTNSLPSRISRNGRDPMVQGDAASRFFTKEDEKQPYASPIRGSFQGFPPVMVHVGTEEVLFDDSMELKRLCEEAGVDITVRVWEGMFHSFCIFSLPETEEAMKEIGAFLRG